MASERVQRRIERLLDQIEEEMDQRNWESVREGARAVLALDSENSDALAFLSAAEQATGTDATFPPTQAERVSIPPAPTATSSAQPTSFAGDRYEVKRFLGEGRKKKVYLAHDTMLDRDVAFALIKTEGLDDVSRTRVSREAQAMGRLGSHPHIVTVSTWVNMNPNPTWSPSLWVVGM